MKLTDLTSLFSDAVSDSSYIDSFEHGYLEGMNDNSKDYPILLLIPPTTQRVVNNRKKEKLYTIDLYVFTISDDFTHAERDAAWQSQEDAIDDVIEYIVENSSKELIIASTPIYERLEDEHAALFNERVCWVECKLQLKVLDCD